MNRPFFHQPSNYALVLLVFALVAYSMIGFTVQADVAVEAQPSGPAQYVDVNSSPSEGETALVGSIQVPGQRAYTSAVGVPVAP